MSAEPHQSSLDLASRLDAVAALGEITSVDQLTPHLRAITIGHSRAEEIAGQPGQDVMVRLERRAGQFVRRRFSVRERGTDQFTLWVTHVHDGVGAEFARRATVGNVVDLVGPRGKVFADPESQHHIFIGDTTSLAAFYALAGSLPADRRATFVIQVDDVTEMIGANFETGLSSRAVIAERGDAPLGSGEPQLRALSLVAFSDRSTHAYVFGEFHAGRTVRTALLDRGFDEDQISVKAYWRYDQGNAEHGEPSKEL